MTVPTGRLIASSAQDKSGAKNWFYLAALITASFAILLVTTGAISRSGNLVMSLIILAVPGLGMVFTAWKAFKQPRQLDIYEDGFVLRNQQNNETLHSGVWQEVSDITWSLTSKQTRNQVIGGAAFGVIGMLLVSRLSPEGSDDETEVYILRPGQKKLAIDTSYRTPARPRMTLGSAAKSAWIADTKAGLSNGRALEFGNITLTIEGARQKNKLAPWSQISDVGYADEQGTVKISWNDPTRRKTQTMNVKLGFKGAVLIDVINEKLGRKSSMASKLGKL